MNKEKFDSLYINPYEDIDGVYCFEFNTAESMIKFMQMAHEFGYLLSVDAWMSEIRGGFRCVGVRCCDSMCVADRGHYEGANAVIIQYKAPTANSKTKKYK